MQRTTTQHPVWEVLAFFLKSVRKGATISKLHKIFRKIILFLLWKRKQAALEVRHKEQISVFKSNF